MKSVFMVRSPKLEAFTEDKRQFHKKKKSIESTEFHTMVLPPHSTLYLMRVTLDKLSVFCPHVALLNLQ